MLVDVHSHVYLPAYLSLLRKRSSVPRIVSDRLFILNHETTAGRPVGPQYWDQKQKIQFMDAHRIHISIISPANPWLDFLPPSDAQNLARELNNDLEHFCSSSPLLPHSSLRRLYGFGLLPLVPDVNVPSLLDTVHQISSLPHLKGVIIGTRGLGNGLDDSALDVLWDAIERARLVVFIHPHYGLDPQTWGEKDNGHVLPLALGFPFETTTTAVRLILSGVLDRFPSLRLLLAHSGGALPLLSSRLASCIDHDPVVANRLKHDARYYLGKLYFDAVAYGPEELGFVSDAISRADRFQSTPSHIPSTITDRKLGSCRMLFGTDHPFFPPLQPTDKWKSVVDNLDAIGAVNGWGQTEKDRVRGENALALFEL